MNERLAFRREVTVAAAGVGVAMLVVCAVLASWWFFAYRAAIVSGERRAANLSLVLDEQTNRTVQPIDLTLRDVSDQLARAPETPSHDPRYTKRLRARLADLPYVRALFVIDRNGRLLQDTDSDTPNVSLADREYFRVHVNDPDRGLYVSPPLQSRSQGAPWFVSVSRGIRLEDGTFYGVAVAALEPKYFAQFYAEISVGTGGMVALVHRNGTVVARYPEHGQGVGVSLADVEQYKRALRSGRSGTYSDTSVVDHLDRLYGYRDLAPMPLVVVVGVSREEILGEWWQTVWMSGAVAAALFVALVSGTVVVLRRRAGERRTAERLRLIDRTEALGQMTSTIAHDFNNLLAVVGGSLEVIARHLPDDGPVRKRVDIAFDAVDRGGRILSQLLAFARHAPPATGPVAPAEVVAGASELLRQAARPCTLHIDAGGEAWSALVDTTEFERALLNLIVNARDASLDRGCDIRVSIRNVRERDLERKHWPDLRPGDHIAVSVRDQGGGMPPEVQRRASEPFFTTKGERGGTGLGLSQVFGFARQSGGGMRIGSAEGAGTTITILIPRAVAEASGDALRRVAGAKPHNGSPGVSRPTFVGEAGGRRQT